MKIVPYSKTQIENVVENFPIAIVSEEMRLLYLTCWVDRAGRELGDAWEKATNDFRSTDFCPKDLSVATSYGL